MGRRAVAALLCEDDGRFKPFDLLNTFFKIALARNECGSTNQVPGTHKEKRLYLIVCIFERSQQDEENLQEMCTWPSQTPVSPVRRQLNMHAWPSKTCLC